MLHVNRRTGCFAEMKKTNEIKSKSNCHTGQEHKYTCQHACLCDDLEASVDGEQIEVTNACELGKRYFNLLPSEPENLVDGEKTDMNTAIAASSIAPAGKHNPGQSNH